MVLEASSGGEDDLVASANDGTRSTWLLCSSRRETLKRGEDGRVKVCGEALLSRQD